MVQDMKTNMFNNFIYIRCELIDQTVESCVCHAK